MGEMGNIVKNGDWILKTVFPKFTFKQTGGEFRKFATHYLSLAVKMYFTLFLI